MSKKNFALGTALAALTGSSSVLYMENDGLTQRVKKLEVEKAGVERCELISCSDPWMSYPDDVKKALNETCENQCPRKQIFLRKDWERNFQVDPLLELTQFWQDGKLQCK